MSDAPPAKRARQADGAAAAAAPTDEERRAAKERETKAMHEQQLKCIFVSGLSPTATKEAVAGFFAACGVVVSCELTRKEKTDAVFAFVEFDCEEAVSNALKRSGAVIAGMKISVQRKKSGGGAAVKEGRTKSTSVFVKFMDTDAPTKPDLYTIFELCGKIRELRMHSSEAYCFIEFHTLAASALALQMDDPRFQIHYSRHERTAVDGKSERIKEVMKKPATCFRPRTVVKKKA